LCGEIVDMLDGIPDLRPALANARPTELADICDAFQITAVYDKANRTVELSATITPELLPKDKTPTDEHDPVGGFVHSGGRIETSTRDHREPRWYWTKHTVGSRAPDRRPMGPGRTTGDPGRMKAPTLAIPTERPGQFRSSPRGGV
jgi:hypothetical protein